MSRVDQVCANVEIDIEEHDEDSIQTLPQSMYGLLGFKEDSYSDEDHQPVFGLEPSDVLEV